MGGALIVRQGQEMSVSQNLAVKFLLKELGTSLRYNLYLYKGIGPGPGNQAIITYFQLLPGPITTLDTPLTFL